MNLQQKSAAKLISHIKDERRFITTADELTDYVKKGIFKALLVGKLCSVFPLYIVEDILSFAKEQLAEGNETILLGIRTKRNGVIIFEYFIETSDRGLELNLSSYYIPDSPSQISIPTENTGKCLVIDVDST